MITITNAEERFWSELNEEVRQKKMARAERAIKESGLSDAIEILKDIPEIGIVTLTHRDVVRHELVQKITEAYDRTAGQSPD